MSADTTENPTSDAAPKPTPPAQATDAPAADPKVDDVDWKAEARKWEARAKENKAVADSGKTEAEKVAERLAEVEKRATEAEARASRRDVAIEFRLTKEDAGLLDAISDEKAMRALAERLAGEADRKQNHVPREGNNPAPGSDPMREFARGLFDRAKTD